MGHHGHGHGGSVSLSSTINNGVATYPMVISVDNTEETLQVNSYINYTLTASENDNCLILPIQCVRTTMLEDAPMCMWSSWKATGRRTPWK